MSDQQENVQKVNLNKATIEDLFRIGQQNFLMNQRAQSDSFKEPSIIKQKKIKKIKKQLRVRQQAKKILACTKNQQKIQLINSFNLNLQFRKQKNQILPNYLKINTSELGQLSLYENGIPNNNIKKYTLDFNFIIGIKQKRQKIYNKLLNSIKQKINNKVLNKISHNYIKQNRYFFIEDQNVRCEQLSKLNYSFADKFYISFNRQKTQIPLTINKDYQKRLNLEKHNIELWLQFINFQKQTFTSQQRIKFIIQKALQLNPMNEKLLCCYFRITLLQKKQIEEKIIEFIKYNCCSIQLWKIYIAVELKHFHTYSHPSFVNFHESIVKMMKKMMNECTSAIQIWKIKETSLLVFREIISVYRLEGYNQLATAMCRALIEYNLFTIQEDFASFRREQQKYNTYKLGDVNSNDIFIGEYQQHQKNKINTIEKQLMIHSNQWRPSHTFHDGQLINESPQSFIFVEQWEFALNSHKDKKSIILLIDNFVDNLGFPLVFAETNINCNFYSNVLKPIIEQSLTRGKQIDFAISPVWISYWPISYTVELLPPSSYSKLIFSYRILRLIRNKYLSSFFQVGEYLMFICLLAQTTSEFEKLLLREFNESNDLLSTFIKELLHEDAFNIKLWAMYISAQYFKYRKQEECLNCYFQLFRSSPTQNKKIQVLFYLHCFINQNKLWVFSQTVMFLLFKYLNNKISEQFTILDFISEKITPFDILQGRQFLQQNIKVPNQELFSSYFVLEMCKKYPYLQIDNRRAIEIIKCKNNVVSKWIAIKHKIVEQCDIQCNTLALLQYKAKKIRKPMTLISFKYTISEWLGIFSILLDDSAEKKAIFFKNGIRLCSVNEPRATILFINLMNKYESCTKQFLFYWLDKLPYCKQLYLLNLKYLKNKGETEEINKLVSILKTKQIRLFIKSFEQE